MAKKLKLFDEDTGPHYPATPSNDLPLTTNSYRNIPSGAFSIEARNHNRTVSSRIDSHENLIGPELPGESHNIAASNNAGNILIDGITYSQKWAKDPTGPYTTLTFSFQEIFDASHPDPRPFGELERQQTRDILRQLETFTNLRFVEINEQEAGHGGVLRFAYDDIGDQVGGLAFPPDLHPLGGNVLINRDYQQYAQTLFQKGDYGYYTLVHEIGHALGLEHPFTGDVTIPSAYDTVYNSVESYTATYLSPSTYMPIDIQALQYLYGANTTFHSGNDTYLIDASYTHVETVWDPKGLDTIVCQGTKSVTIDLAGGAVNQLPGTDVSVRASFGITIENAVGGDGNDVIIANTAVNQLSGGLGNDLFIGADFYDSIDGGQGFDTVDYGYTHGIFLNSYARISNIENILGSYSSDTFILSFYTTDIKISGRDGSDLIISGSGNDALDGGDGNDTIDGGAGNDTINGALGTDTINGGDGNDTITTTDMQDTIDGGVGTDTLDYAQILSGIRFDSSTHVTGIENILGTNYDDYFDLNGRDIQLFSSNGNDVVVTGSGHYFIITGQGDDIVYVGGRADTASNLNFVYGDVGNDTFYVSQSSHTTLYGGTGINLLDFSNLTNVTHTGVVVLGGSASSGSDIQFNFYQIDNINGSSYSDQIHGNNNANRIYGGAGNDILDGDFGNDALLGGTGKDTLTGGQGSDSFVFSTSDLSTSLSATDVITDFAVGSGGDILDLLTVTAGPSPSQLRLVDSAAGSTLQVFTSQDLPWQNVAFLQGIHVSIDTLFVNNQILANTNPSA